MTRARPGVRSSMAGGREPKPLPFDPGEAHGLVREADPLALGEQLHRLGEDAEHGRRPAAAAMNEPDLPPAVYGGLKREELHRLGSVILHEQYFGNLGGDGRAGGDILAAIKKAYGSYEAWDAEFRRTAMSLAGGSGWCVLTYNVYTNELRNQWAWDHMHGAIAAVPLLVLDMYEHSYHMDYGSAAAKYVDAFMRNVKWEEVDRRFGALPA